MAGRLIDLDPELAFQHALAASRRGGRLAAVREAVGLTAYAAGHYGEALREFRTFRRISGSNVHLPVMADCERGLGRPDRALDLARSEEAESLDAAGKAELAMVVSGARADLGQLDAAVAALEIPQLDLHRAFTFSPRLFRAYADALDAVGRSDESDKWRRQALVAEKALGIDDDLEPDIIDLGEDEDPAPVQVPKVADLLGAQAAPTASSSAAAESGSSSGVSSEAGSGSTAESKEGSGDVREESKPGGADVDAVDAATKPVADAVVPGLEGDAGAPDVTTSEKAQSGAVSEGAVSEGAVSEGAVSEGAVSEGAVSEGAVPDEAEPVAESSAQVEPLQTEMLFSMNETGAADIEPGDAEAGSAEGAEDAKDEAAPPAPKRTRISKAKASKEEPADD